MKKFLFALLLITSPVSFAQEAKGVIEAIKICGTGARGYNNNGVDWARTLQFKVDGKWFGTYADYFGSPNDNDNNISTSLVFMAYSQKLPLHIKATDAWHNNMKKCGVSEGAIFQRNAGDFISIGE